MKRVYILLIFSAFIIVGCRTKKVIQTDSFDSIQNGRYNERIVYREKINIKDSVRYELRGCTVFVDRWHSSIYESKDTVIKCDTVYRYIRRNNTVTITKKDNNGRIPFVINIVLFLGTLLFAYFLAKRL